MDSSFKINNSTYNYSGYGQVLDEFGGPDSFDDVISVEKKSGDEVYIEILSQLGIEHADMINILNVVCKSVNVDYKFIRVNNDFQILFFEDEFGHITPVPLKKILSCRNSFNKRSF